MAEKKKKENRNIEKPSVVYVYMYKETQHVTHFNFTFISVPMTLFDAVNIVEWNLKKNK